MDAAMVTAIAALIAGPVAAVGAMYGQRGANRAAKETSAVTGYDSLTQRLVAERDKAEMDEKTAEARASAAEAKVASLEAEVSRLRLLVQQLGGTP
ncbi:hypothetical protein [Streptomyces ipomoeae]|uniref:hypothetical protein n=1 Tax=Streptomyces ipomoeae TaxID=103232 RepID=UPI0029A4791A|nr:hypothetical protein [Streptomyces ipomoeae]MDX2697116.1 hypothetical protein [Streptomyces ipomoeae]